MATHEILILEDNVERQSAMRARLSDRFPQYPVSCFHEPARLIAHLRDAESQPLLISLDHDLELIPQADGSLLDPGSGQTAVDWLITQPVFCPVIVHSTNVPAATIMQQRLRQAGWTVSRITPYDDLAWIDLEWFTAARSFLLQSADINHTSVDLAPAASHAT